MMKTKRKQKKAEQLIHVSSAMELEPEVKEKILHFLDRPNAQVKFRVDPSLIAGVQIQGPNVFYDNSIKRQLDLVYRHLSKDGGM